MTARAATIAVKTRAAVSIQMTMLYAMNARDADITVGAGVAVGTYLKSGFLTGMTNERRKKFLKINDQHE